MRNDERFNKNVTCPLDTAIGRKAAKRFSSYQCLFAASLFITHSLKMSSIISATKWEACKS